MVASLLSIGLSGVKASNALITTTGQNVANVNTPGYNRQTTSLSANYGGGVDVADTKRVVDQYLNQQVRLDTANNSYFENYYRLASVSDELVGDQSVSLNTYLDNMFTSLQSANADPTDAANRQMSFSNLGNLVNQFNALADFVSEQKSIADGQLTTSLEQTNQIAQQIADLNGKIFAYEATGLVANELRDQQEELAKQVSELVNVKVSYDSSGLMELQFAGGQPLVLQDKSNSLVQIPNDLNPNQFDVKLDFGKYKIGIDGASIGGKVGASVDFSHDLLTEMDRRLGQQAIVIADAMNQQNKLGLDADGLYGKDLLSLASVSVYSGQTNSSRAHQVDVRITDGQSSDITTDTYRLSMTSATSFDVRGYDASGKQNGVLVSVDMTTAVPDAEGYYTLAGLGLQVQLQADPNSAFASGDTYEFTPTERAAEGLSLAATSGNAFALNAPIQVSNASSNLSDAKISIASVTDLQPASSAFTLVGGLDVTAPHTIRFTAMDAFEVLDSNGNALANVAGVTSYKNLLEQAGLADVGYDVSLSAVPAAGDSFGMAFNQSGRADNYNGLKLASLQNESLIEGKASFSQSYTGLASNIGSVARSLKLNVDSSNIMLQQSLNRRDEMSAVSSDEEAVKLLRYQQSYSAAAQVITAARDTFQTLLSAMR